MKNDNKIIIKEKNVCLLIAVVYLQLFRFLPPLYERERGEEKKVKFLMRFHNELVARLARK